MQPFRYFRNPTSPLSPWTDEPAPCGLCGTVGPGFAGGYYGENDDLVRVCEVCLRAGRIAEVGCSTCDGDSAALRDQLRARHPEMSAVELERVAAERDRTLSTKTPQLITWQDFLWPAHCGDYCEFVEELGKPEIRTLAGDEDPEIWLAAHVIDADLDSPWQGIRENSAREFPEQSYDTTVYRFGCRECRNILLHWDCN